MASHPNISDERIQPQYIEDVAQLSDYDDIFSGPENESDDTMQCSGFLPHPNISFSHDPEIASRVRPKNQLFNHPNVFNRNKSNHGSRFTAPMVIGFEAFHRATTGSCECKIKRSEAPPKTAIRMPQPQSEIIDQNQMISNSNQSTNVRLNRDSCECKRSTTIQRPLMRNALNCESCECKKSRLINFDTRRMENLKITESCECKNSRILANRRNVNTISCESCGGKLSLAAVGINKEENLLNRESCECKRSRILNQCE